MKTEDGLDVQWVVYHGSAWERLVEQGYVTAHVETRTFANLYGAPTTERWAMMIEAKEGKR